MQTPIMERSSGERIGNPMSLVRRPGSDGTEPNREKEKNMRQITGGFLVLVIAAGLVPLAAPVAGVVEDVPIAVAPHVILLGSDQGGWVTVHVELPYGDVVGETVELNGIPVDRTFADARGEFVGKFSEDDVKAIVSPPEAEMTITGVTVGGDAFSGSCTVRVRVIGRR
jgi:hypothetical protein